MEKLKAIAAQALQILKDKGADSSIVTVKEAVTNEFNVAAGEFTLLRTLNTNSINLTAICGGKKGSAAVNSLEKEAIEQAADTCFDVAMSGQPDPNWGLCPDPNRGSYDDGIFEPDLEKFFARSKELLETIKKDYPLISPTEIVLEHIGGKSIYANSSGALFESRGGAYSIFVEFCGVKDGKTSSFFGSGYTTLDLDTPFIDQCTVRQDLQAAVDSIETVPFTGKFTGTLLLEPGCALELIGCALGSFTGDRSLISGTSIWKDRLGTQVASPLLTLQSDPYDKRVIGGQRWTSEGFVAEPYTYIDKGVLKDFNLSLYGANKTGLQRAKNSAGGNIIESGETTLAEIIRGVDKGLYVGRFSGGEPSSSGDFSGVAKGAFLIENGKIGPAVSETMISGNLADMLMNIRAVSKETVCDGNFVLPWIAADGIVISGK